MITQMLKKEPTERITAAGILEHPWITANAEELENQVIDLAHIQEYSKADTFQRTAITTIASRCKQEDIKKLADQFNAIDTNNSGTINMEEFRAAIHSANLNITQEEME